MDIEEKIFRKVVKYFSIWFLCMALFVWEEPKPVEWTEDEIAYSCVPDEEYLEEEED